MSLMHDEDPRGANATDITDKTEAANRMKLFICTAGEIYILVDLIARVI